MDDAVVRTLNEPVISRLLEQPEGSAYVRVLDELYRKRREIDHAIAAIEEMAGDRDELVRPEGDLHRRRRSPQPRVAEAVKSVLSTFGRPARNAEIKAALIESGYRFTAWDADVSIVQALNRLAAANEVVKIGRGLWARRS